MRREPVAHNEARRREPVVMTVTTAHQAIDQRIAARECVSLSDGCYRVVLVARGRLDDRVAKSVHHIPLPGAASRWRRLLVLQPAVVRAVRTMRPDVIHVHDPELIPLARIAQRLGYTCIYDAHEDLPRDVLSKEWIPSLLRPGVASITEALLRMAGKLDAVVVATPEIARGFSVPTTLVGNFPRSAEFDDVLPDFSSRTALYVGGMERVRGILEMVDAIGAVPDSRLVLAGRFSDPAYEAEVRNSPGWSRVEHSTWMSRDELRSAMQGAAIGLVPFQAIPNHMEALPTKVFEYMSATLPVLATDLPAVREVLDRTGAGIVVAAGDGGAFAAALSELLDAPDRLRAMGQLGRAAAVSTYNWENESRRLIGLYRELVG